MNFALADIGGTFIKYGVANGRGDFFKMGKTENPVRELGVSQMLAAVSAALDALIKEHGAAGIGIATPGVVSDGKILYAGKNFPGYIGTDLKKYFTEKFHLPCAVENDVNAAALGEYYFGAGDGASPFFCVMLGTGVGGALLSGGKIFRGALGFAGEIGYIPFKGGTVEDYASASAIIRRVSEKINTVNDPDVENPARQTESAGLRAAALARDGSEYARAAFNDAAEALAFGLSAVCCVANPQKIVIGGGITAASDILEEPLKNALLKLLPKNVIDATEIKFSKLENTAGMLGALKIIEVENLKLGERDGN